MWTEHILNPELLSNIFKGEMPSFNNVEVKEIKLVYGEDLMCNIYLHIHDIPALLPDKWIQRSVNILQFNFSLIKTRLNQLSCEGILVANLSITYNDDEFTLIFQQEDRVVLDLQAKWIFLDVKGI